jgi:hypothetical protein
LQKKSFSLLFDRKKILDFFKKCCIFSQLTIQNPQMSLTRHHRIATFLILLSCPKACFLGLFAFYFDVFCFAFLKRNGFKKVFTTILKLGKNNFIEHRLVAGFF